MNPRKLLRLKPRKVARRAREYVLFALMRRGSDKTQPIVRVLIERQAGEAQRWSVRASVTNNCICRIYVLGVFLRTGGPFRLTAESRKDNLSATRPFGRSGVLTALSIPEPLHVGASLTDAFSIEPKDPACEVAPTADDFIAMYRRHDDRERIRIEQPDVTFDEKDYRSALLRRLPNLGQN